MYYKTLGIHNLVKMYRYHGKGVSFLLSVTVALLKTKLDGKQNDRWGTVS